ncbi:beta-N-acetylhexosaminidase [Reichenbachiella ulvae]|uniref:beta-N-acetylhexosaminidase n=1 Tax=Reichenbachiella ulvae TaxID=2980104 RepID=A0ABT3CYV7_9BACT|nr:family 20 glycosylhydrolase [Reichenbachiella ulvae]MCV9388769.1 family 20 glycosylhydrolase [Reichenbachiella ulvae]
MSRILIFLLLATLVFACSTEENKKYEGTISVIPEPVSLTQNEGVLTLEKGLAVWAQSGNEDAVKVAEQFVSRMNKVTGWDLKVQELDTDQLPGANQVLFTTLGASEDQGEESYTLESTAKGVVIRAVDGPGMFYGMQTLMQLLPTEVYGDEIAEVSWDLPLVSIVDYPRFEWRGLHLDVGRHMTSVEFIKEYIDNMAMHKLNTFHWHLTEDQGWRIEIKQYPKLTEIGAYRKESLTITRRNQPKEYDGKRYGGFYTQEEIKEVVAYAADRYITVIPEIELPGHATAAIASYPELGTSGERPEVETDWGIFPDIFNVNDETFVFLENVLSEVIELFPSKYIHIGGDEAMKVQWEESEEIQAKIKELGLKDEHELQSYFITRIEKFVNSKGRQIIGWDEILEGGLAPNAAVMSWRGESGGIAAAKSKHKVVMSPYQHLYLDYHQGDPAFEPTVIGPLLTLEDVYAYDPLPDTLTEEEKTYIMGAQANVWTEYMPTEDQMEYMVYPRASALAELVWTPKSNKDWSQFQQKIPTHLDRLEERDVNYAKSIFNVSFKAEMDSVAGNYTVSLNNQMGWDGMRYTVDGSSPTLESPLYESPLTLDSGTLIKAKLFDERIDSQMTSKVIGEE